MHDGMVVTVNSNPGWKRRIAIGLIDQNLATQQPLLGSTYHDTLDDAFAAAYSQAYALDLTINVCPELEESYVKWCLKNGIDDQLRPSPSAA